MIIGIALVVDDVSKGTKLVIRYPPPPTPTTSPSNQQGRSQADISADELEEYEMEHIRNFHSLPASLFAKLFRPKNALCNKIFELAVDDLHFISHPVETSSPSDELTQIANAFLFDGKSEMTLLNVIFVLNTYSMDRIRAKSGLRVQRRSRKLGLQSNVQRYKDFAVILARALLHEERRARYVSKEVRVILNTREEVLRSSEKETFNYADIQTFVDVALSRSSLANELKEIYHGLRESGSVHLMINEWIEVSFKLYSPLHPSMLSIRPYQTLLLLCSVDKALGKLSRDSSPQLQKLIREINPLKSFQELSIETDIPLAQLFRLAVHLVFWKVARIVDTITLYSIYQINPSTSLDMHSLQATDFRRQFGEDLFEFIERFRDGWKRRVGVLLQDLSLQQQSRFLSMLVWLLQHDMLIQLHRYVHLMIPKPEEDHQLRRSDSSPSSEYRASATSTPRRRDQSWTDIGTSPAESVVADSDIFGHRAEESEPLELRTYEEDYLNEKYGDNPNYHLFRQLCPYFRGKHHFEEIMWREDLPRKSVRKLLSVFSEVAVTYIHE